MPMPEQASAVRHSFGPRLCALVLGLGAVGLCPTGSVALGGQAPEGTATFTPRTKVSITAGRWCLNGEVTHGASWGLMANEVNQRYPFHFEGARDDPVVYAKLKELTSLRSRPASSG